MQNMCNVNQTPLKAETRHCADHFTLPGGLEQRMSCTVLYCIMYCTVLYCMSCNAALAKATYRTLQILCRLYKQLTLIISTDSIDCKLTLEQLCSMSKYANLSLRNCILGEWDI